MNELSRALELARQLGSMSVRTDRADAVDRIFDLMELVPRTPNTPVNDVVPFESFGPESREILQHVAREHGAADRRSLPMFAFDLLPWTGVVPPRVLELPLPGGVTARPRWLALQEGGLEGTAWPETRDYALRGLDVVQRLEATFLVSVGAYRIEKLFAGAAFTDECAGLLSEAGEPGLVYARNLVTRLGQLEDPSTEIGLVAGRQLDPFFEALHRDGFRLPAGVHNRILWTAKNRQLLATLTAEERSAMVAKKTRSWGAPNLKMEMDAIEALADLLVTPAFLEHLRGIVTKRGLDTVYGARLDELERRMRAGWI